MITKLVGGNQNIHSPNTMWNHYMGISLTLSYPLFSKPNSEWPIGAYILQSPSIPLRLHLIDTLRIEGKECVTVPKSMRAGSWLREFYDKELHFSFFQSLLHRGFKTREGNAMHHWIEPWGEHNRSFALSLNIVISLGLKKTTTKQYGGHLYFQDVSKILLSKI